MGKGSDRHVDSRHERLRHALAQPPDINETFLREVDENLRRDQLRDFAKKYGGWLIAAVVLFLVASGGFIWWQQHKVQRSEQQVEQLAEIYKDIGGGNTAPGAAAARRDGRKRQQGRARFGSVHPRGARARSRTTRSSRPASIARSPSDSGLPQPYRDAALIRQTALEFDQLQPQEVIARLQPLAKPGEPWFGSAGEMTALALDQAGPEARGRRSCSPRSPRTRPFPNNPRPRRPDRRQRSASTPARALQPGPVGPTMIKTKYLRVAVLIAAALAASGCSVFKKGKGPRPRCSASASRS